MFFRPTALLSVAFSGDDTLQEHHERHSVSLLQGLAEYSRPHVTITSFVIGIVLLASGLVMLLYPFHVGSESRSKETLSVGIYGAAAIGSGAMLVLTAIITFLARDVWAHLKTSDTTSEDSTEFESESAS